MKFLCLYRPGTPENNDPPTETTMREMGALIGDMPKAGVLLATEGCLPSDRGAKLRITSGKYTVTDGPFPETKELVRLLSAPDQGQGRGRRVDQALSGRREGGRVRDPAINEMPA